MRVIISKSILAIDLFGSSLQFQKLQRHQLPKPGGRRGLNSPRRNFFHTNTDNVFVAVASSDAICSNPLTNFPVKRGAFGLSPIQAEARSSMDDRFVSTPEITISRYAGS
jgi:hypothetical protein